MTTQDPELSAALGWPGGISDPVLDRTRLLQMVAALRLAAQQALEACEQRLPLKGQAAIIDELNNLRAALAQQDEPVEPVAQQAKPLTGLDMFLDPNDGLKPKPYKPRAEPAHGIKE